MNNVELKKYYLSTRKQIGWRDRTLLIDSQPNNKSFNEESINEYLKPVIKTVVGFMGMSSPQFEDLLRVDSIFEFLNGKELKGFTETFIANELELLKDLPHGEILKISQELKISNNYDCLQALGIACKVLIRDFLEGGNYFIYFKDAQIDPEKVFLFKIWRHNCQGIFGASCYGKTLEVKEVDSKVVKNGSIVIF